jgi:nucleoside-diphosphate-sugar epimerase
VTTLVAGAGFVGGPLIGELIRRGERALSLRRSAHEVESGALALRADLLDRASLDAALAGQRVERLVFLASPGGGDVLAYQRIYLEGLGNVLDVLLSRGPLARALVVTSTAVYAQEDGEWVDETSPALGQGTARVLLEGEALLASRVSQSSAVRLAGIYGPGRDRMIRAVREGRARIPAEPRWTNRIHRDDAAAALAHLVCREREPAPIYIGVDDEPAQLGDVYRWLAQELPAPEPAVGDDERVPRSGSKRARNARLRETGWTPRYPSYREGYRSMLV